MNLQKQPGIFSRNLESYPIPDYRSPERKFSRKMSDKNAKLKI